MIILIFQEEFYIFLLYNYYIIFNGNNFLINNKKKKPKKGPKRKIEGSRKEPAFNKQGVGKVSRSEKRVLRAILFSEQRRHGGNSGEAE